MNYKIISKFIKDISFEIPDAQTFVMIEKEILNYNLNFDIKSNPFKENIIEVNTILRLIPNQNVKNKMLAEINLTTLASIDESDKKELEKIIFSISFFSKFFSKETKADTLISVSILCLTS